MATLPNFELMNAQPELRWFMRPYLVDFIVEIHQTFRLRPETLYLTMNIVDRYVSKRIVFKRHYQLVGSAALLIAAKYEDAKDRVPTVADLCSMCCQAYDESAFHQMEGHILQTLSWQLGHPTPEAWLRQLCVPSAEEAKTQCVARFLMETTLFHREFIGIPSSLIASASLIVGRHICNSAYFTATETTPFHSREEVASVAKLLDSHISQNLQDLSLILVKKYSYQHYCGASTVVRNHYTQQRAQQQKEAEGATLLPAHSLSQGGIPASSSTDSCDTDVDPDCSMSSGESTPRSNRTDDDDDDDEDEDDDEDMPVTPLSLNNIHDPLSSESAAALHSSSSPRSKAQKKAAAVAAAAAANSSSRNGGSVRHSVHEQAKQMVLPIGSGGEGMKTSSSLSQLPSSQQQQRHHHQHRSHGSNHGQHHTRVTQQTQPPQPQFTLHVQPS